MEVRMIKKLSFVLTALFLLVPVALRAATSTSTLTLYVAQGADPFTLPNYKYSIYNKGITSYGYVYPKSIAFSANPTAPVVVTTTLGANGAFTITPTAVGTTALSVTFQEPTNNTGTYVNDTYIYNITVLAPASTQAASVKVGILTTIPVHTGAISSFTITQNGASVASTWAVTAGTSSVQVQTYQLGTATLETFIGGVEYEYDITSNLWAPGSGQVVLADVSTTQPEYQNLIANRSTAETYAASISLWNYAVRRYKPATFTNSLNNYDGGTIPSPNIAFSYNSSDNVLVLEGTYVNGVYLTNGTGSVLPTSSGSAGVSYDPSHGVIYGDPSGNSVTLPYSAAMAITGTNGTVSLNNPSGYISVTRVPNTNLTLMGVTGDDDAGYGTSYGGYEISYLQAGSLPGEQPPTGVITASTPQVLSTANGLGQPGAPVTITWNLD
jgi:hypothetical protein